MSSSKLFFSSDLDRVHAFNFLEDLSDKSQNRIETDWSMEISRKLEVHNGRIKVANVKVLIMCEK